MDVLTILLYITGFGIIVNFLLIAIIILVWLRQGPFFMQSVKVSLGLLKQPNLFIRFLNSKQAIIEWREYKPVIKIDPKEATSDLVYLDRDAGFNPFFTKNQKPGIIGRLLGKKYDPEKELNTVYNNDFVAVNFKDGTNYHSMGTQLHVIYEGQNSTQNPLASYKQAEQVKKASISVELAYQGHKILAEDEFRKNMATRSDVWVSNLIVGGVLMVGIVAVFFSVGTLTDVVKTFTGFVENAYNNAKPAIDSWIATVPHKIIDQNFSFPVAP